MDGHRYMEFGLLGEVEVAVAGRPVDAGHARQRCVLVALLVDVNLTVSADQLVDRVWGEHRLPARPANAIHTYISLLRRALADAPEVEIQRRPGGYRLTADPEAVDLHRFHRLIAEARAAVGDRELAADLFERALALWRGTPFANLDTVWLDDVRAALAEERHAALLDLTDIRLRLGRHGAVLAELSDRAGGRALDERLSGQLMLALYRSGRQAEALAEYRRIRSRLADELGTDPGMPLQALHQRILAGDPALSTAPADPAPGGARLTPARLSAPPRQTLGAATRPSWYIVPVPWSLGVTTPNPPPGTAAPPTGAAAPPTGAAAPPTGTAAPSPPPGTATRSPAPGAAASPAVIEPAGEVPVSPGGGVTPHQLPAPPRLFVGRARELDQLTAALDEEERPGGAVVISAIVGSGGIGKTWLALHWAHGNIHRFPDGQLHVNLRGYDPSGSPVPVAVALRGFLDALGVPAAAIPRDLDAQAGLYRSLVAGRRMLIMLDNARDAAQVVPLLPGTPTCAVLVTSRRRMAGLVTAHGAHSVDVGVLSEPEARALLTGRLGGERVAAEPGAAAELLAHCAGMPLAIAVLAARATAHPHLPLTALADELRQASARLDALDTGDLTANMRAVLSWSYETLGAEAEVVFGLVGLAPGPDIGVAAAAALTGLTVARTRVVLRDLDDAHLIGRHQVDRYRMHDLIRLYAADRSADPTATDADRSADPTATDAGRSAGTAGTATDAPHRDGPALRRLLDHYLHTAHACDLMLDPHRMPIEAGPALPGSRPVAPRDQAAALAWFGDEHRCLLAAQQLAAEMGDDRAVWRLAWALDTYQRWQGHPHDNLAAWRAGMRAAQRTGDPAARELAHRHLGRACFQAGDHIEALDHLHRALALAAETNDIGAQAHAHHTLASAWDRRGNAGHALEHATRALGLFERIGNPAWHAMALNQAGWCQSRLGHFREASAHCERALTLFRGLRDRVGEAITLDSLGYVAHSTGRQARALFYYNEALELQRALGNTYWCAEVLDHIGAAHAVRGHLTDALFAWRQARMMYRAQHRVLDAERLHRQISVISAESLQRLRTANVGAGS